MWREADVFYNLDRGSEARNAQLGSALELAQASRSAVITPEGLLHRLHTDQNESISPTMLLATLPPAVALMLFIGIACGQQAVGSPPETPTPTEIVITQTPILLTPTIEPSPTSSPSPEKKAEQNLFKDNETYASTAGDPTTGVFDAATGERKGGIVFSWLPEQGLFIYYIAKTPAGGYTTPVVVIPEQGIQGNSFRYNERDFYIIEGTVNPQHTAIEGKIWRKGKTPSGEVALLLQYKFKAGLFGKERCSAADASREMKRYETNLGAARARLDDLIETLNKTGNTLPCAS